MNYTSIEQSKKLLELGLNPNTADMFYSRRPTGESEYNVFPDFKPDGRLEVFTKVDLPCWSLEVLLKLISLVALESQHKDIWICSVFYDNNKVREDMIYGNSPLDAAFNAVVWILENKTEKQ